MLSAFSKIPQQRHNCVLVVLTTFEQLLQIVQIQKNKKNIRLKYLHKRSQLS